MDWDRKKFNEDPKHEAERVRMDDMVEDSVSRIIAKRKAAGGGDENIFDSFAKFLTGRS